MKSTLLILGLSAFMLGGCALDTVVDCANLCERYADCFDPSADQSACTTRCESRVEAGEEDRADRCDACLDAEETCATAAVICGGECSPLLAP